jgi:hypothetical protein
MLSGGSGGRNDSSGGDACDRCDFGFDGWIAAGIQDFPGMNTNNFRYMETSLLFFP